MIEFINVTHTYMNNSELAHSAISDISFSVAEGEFFCVIGQTGSGKSTLIQHINGLIMPTSGKVLVDGFDMSQKKQLVSGRRLVGMVFQYPEHQLFAETVYKDIEFGVANLGIVGDEAHERITSAMEAVGLSVSEFSEKSPFDLSGGEKRRVALAGIIAMRPKYLVLDEPMAGLDPIGRQSILALLRQLQSELGITIIMVSHSMDDIVHVASRIAILSRGKIAAIGTPSEVFKSCELGALGLKLPQSIRLIRLLRERGIDIQDEMLEDRAIVDELLRRYRRA